jgi:(E)-4-hydroxy-3-methylbut-2-enyl-diphosphate synthase
VDASEASVGAEWLERIEAENAGELTPERIAAMEAAAAASEDGPVRLDEEASPVAGRRFTRA